MTTAERHILHLDRRLAQRLLDRMRMIGADVLAQDLEKLFSSAALVALHVPNYDELTFGSASGKSQVGERVSIFRQLIDLGKDGYPSTHGDECLERGNLGATITNLWDEIMIAEEAADLA